MNKKARLVVAGVALAALTTVGAGTAAFAHHAFAAEFDADAPVLLKGKVVTVEWVNPHTWIHINVPDTDAKGKEKKGTVFNWAIEGGTPNTIFRQPDAGKGMSSADQAKARSVAIPKGTEVVVRGYQSKDALCDVHPKTKVKTCKANGRDVTFPNGCKLFVGSSGTGAPRDGSDTSEGGRGNECNVAASPA